MRKLFASFFLTVLILLHAGITGASAPGSAEIISPVNLRQGPGLDSSVISVLQQGQKVSVLDRNNNWFMVSVDNETYGFKGWVYGDYLESLTLPEPASVPSKPADSAPNAASPEAVAEAKNPAEAVSSNPAAIAVEEKPAPVQKAGGVEIQKRSEAPVQADSQPAGRSQAPIQQKVPVRTPAAPPDLQAPLEQAENAVDTAPAPLRQQTASPRQSKEAGGMAPRWPEGDRALIEAESVNAHPFPFAGLVLKLSMVLFCCISLVVSAKAYITAKEARKTQS